MRQTLLVLLLFKSVIANDDSDEKYIDLLPEEEKREFLEKIARRILEDYRNNNAPIASHVNISDDALNTHTAYVQGLLKEERSKQIERSDNQDEPKNNIEVNNRKSNENENKFIDLTLRTNKRDKRRYVQNENINNNYSVVPVLPLYDGEDFDKPEKQTKVNESLVTDTVSNNDMSKYEVTKNETLLDGSKNTSFSNNLRHSYIYDESEENGKIKSTVIDGFDPNSSDNDENLTTDVTTEETTTKSEEVSSTTLSSNSLTTAEHNLSLSRKENKPFEGTIEKENNNETIELNYAEKFLSTNMTFESQTEQATTDFVNTESITETVTIPNTFAVTSRQHSILDIIKDKPHLLRNKTVFDGNISLMTMVRSKPLNDSINSTTLSTISSSTEKAITYNGNPVNVTSTTEYSYLESEKSSLHKENSTMVATEDQSTSIKDVSFDKINKNIQRTFSKQRHNDVFRARKKYPQKHFVKSEKTIIKDVQTIESSEMGSKENKSIYYVYEVSAERPPFISRNDEEEHPHYAPVYNYSPEFAYYSPYNRLGPNENDNIDETKVSINDLRTLIKDMERRHRFRNPNSVYINPYKLKVLNVLKHKNQYNMLEPRPVIANSDNYNPNDYIDLDYFFGRNDQADTRAGKTINEDQSKYFPDTIESDHPYATYPNGKVQDHASAVRKLLYAKQRFGYIPPINKKSNDETNKLRSRGYKLHNAFRSDDDMERDDIAIDYYFGRQNSHEISLNKNRFKYRLHNFSPITPIPIERTKKREEVKNVSYDLDATIRVLKDFIKMDNEALVNYDWLGTAVDVQSALEKLTDLTEQLKMGKHLHPSDFELLKYVIYLYKSSRTTNEATVDIKLLQSTLGELRKNIKKKSLVPTIFKKKKGFNSAIKMWKDFATFLRSLVQNKKEVLDQFQSFLAEVVFNLNDLHDAIKHVAMVTTYETQRWHADLKDLYLRNADRRKILEVILHLSVSRLLGLIEESSRNGLEDNFSDFVKKNEKDVDTARQELMFVLLLLNEFKRIN